MAANVVKVFVGDGEVLVFNVNGTGQEEYFNDPLSPTDSNGLRHYDDYDESLMELPLRISNRELRVDTDRILT